MLILEDDEPAASLLIIPGDHEPTLRDLLAPPCGRTHDVAATCTARISCDARVSCSSDEEDETGVVWSDEETVVRVRGLHVGVESSRGLDAGVNSSEDGVESSENELGACVAGVDSFSPAS